MTDLLSTLSGWLSYGSFFLVFAATFAIIVLGLNLQWGFTGLFNVGVAGFVAVGAYTSALLTTPATADRALGLGWPVAASTAWSRSMPIRPSSGKNVRPMPSHRALCCQRSRAKSSVARWARSRSPPISFQRLPPPA